MVERQWVMCMMKRWCECKKYKKKFIESVIFHELCMLMVEKVSIFSKKFIIINVLRATSFLPLVTLFLIKNVYRNESKNTLAYNTVCCYKLLASTKHCFLGCFRNGHPHLVSQQA